MENERKSVFERLGTIRSKQSPSNAAVSSHELNRDDLRHRVVHLSKRRSHHQTSPIAPSMHPYHQHSLAMKRPKLNVPEPPPPPPPPTKQTTNVRKRRKKPKVIDQEALDEGEIVDDDDDDDDDEYEEYEEEEDEEEEDDDEKEEGEIDFKKSTRTRLSSTNTQKDTSSLHFDGENTHHHQKNGRTAQPVKVKSELNDSQMIRIKEEIFDDDDNRMQSTSQVGSDYSDWSDGEDDELLVLENSDQKMNKGTMIATSMNGERTVMIKEEMEDSITAVRNFEDLEAISEDELDPLSDDFFDKSQTDMDDLLNKSDSLSQFPENGNSSTANGSDVCGNLKLLDILEIDWKSLITEKPSADSAGGESSHSDSAAKDSHAEFRHRNSTILLLNRIGFSRDLAGPQLSAFIDSQLAEKLKEQYVPMTHRLPALHCYYRGKQELREGFFQGSLQQENHPSSNAENAPLNGAKIEAFGRMAI